MLYRQNSEALLYSIDRVAKFDPKFGSQRTTKIKILVKTWLSSSLFWLSSFCYLIIYACGTSSHTVVFVGKRKIT